MPVAIEMKKKITCKQIRELREALGLSQVDFARQLGVVTRTVGNWERSTPPSGPTAQHLWTLYQTHVRESKGDGESGASENGAGESGSSESGAGEKGRRGGK